MARAGNSDQRLSFLVVARTDPGPYPHPVEIAVHADGARSRMSFSIGPHAANAGGQLALARVLDEERSRLNPMFETEFAAADLHWLVPCLVRLQSGEDVLDEIAEAYAGRHGRAPGWLRQERYGE